MRILRIVLTYIVFCAVALPALPQQASTPEQAPKRLAHSKYMGGDYGGTSVYIPKLLKHLNKDVTIEKYGPHRIESGFVAPPYAPFELVANHCTTDVSVVAKAGQASSDITADGHFLYTDVSFAVEDVPSNRSVTSVGAGSAITVTRPGGEIRANGHVIRAVDPAFKPFQPGHIYLLYLRSIEGDTAFIADFEGSYDITANKIKPMYSLSGMTRFESGDELVAVARRAGMYQCGGAR